MKEESKRLKEEIWGKITDEEDEKALVAKSLSVKRSSSVEPLCTANLQILNLTQWLVAPIVVSNFLLPLVNYHLPVSTKKEISKFRKFRIKC